MRHEEVGERRQNGRARCVGVIAALLTSQLSPALLGHIYRLGIETVLQMQISEAILGGGAADCDAMELSVGG